MTLKEFHRKLRKSARKSREHYLGVLGSAKTLFDKFIYPQFAENANRASAEGDLHRQTLKINGIDFSDHAAVSGCERPRSVEVFRTKMIAVFSSNVDPQHFRRRTTDNSLFDSRNAAILWMVQNSGGNFVGQMISDLLKKALNLDECTMNPTPDTMTKFDVTDKFKDKFKDNHTCIDVAADAIEIKNTRYFEVERGDVAEDGWAVIFQVKTKAVLNLKTRKQKFSFKICFNEYGDKNKFEVGRPSALAAGTKMTELAISSKEDVYILWEMMTM